MAADLWWGGWGPALTKICALCGADCSDRPRVKDPRGRYFCKGCYQRSIARQRAAAAEVAGAGESSLLGELLADAAPVEAPEIPALPRPTPASARSPVGRTAPADAGSMQLWVAAPIMVAVTGAAFAFGSIVTGIFVAFVAIVTVNGYWIGGLRIAGLLAGLLAAALVAVPLGRGVEGLIGTVIGTTGLTNRFISIAVVAVVTIIAVAIASQVALSRVKDKLGPWTRHDRAIGAGLGLAEGGLLGFLMLWAVFSREPVAVTSLSGQERNPISEGVLAAADSARRSVVGRAADAMNPFDEMRMITLFKNALIVLNDPGASAAFVNHPAVEAIRNRESVQQAMATLSADPEIGLILESGEMSADQLRVVLDSDAVLSILDDGRLVADLRPMIGDLSAALDEAMTRRGMSAEYAVAAPYIDDLVEGYIDDLATGTGRTRLKAAQSLGGIGPYATSAVPALVGALTDLDPGVRVAAADALGRIGPGAADAIPALERLTEDQDLDLRASARVAIQRIEAPPEAGEMLDPVEGE